MPSPRAAVNTSVIYMALREPSSIMARIVESWYDDDYLLVCTDDTLREYYATLLDPANLLDHPHEIRVREFLELAEAFAERAHPTPETYRAFATNMIELARSCNWCQGGLPGDGRSRFPR